MKSTLILTAIAAASLASAQDFDLAFAAGRKGLEPAVARKLGQIDRFLNTRWSLDLDAFAGSAFQNGALFGGFAGTVAFPIGDLDDKKLTFCPGVYARFVSSRPVQGGLFFGFRVR